MVALRKLLPPYTLHTPGGERVYLPDLKGKILVLLRNPGMAQALALRQEELATLEAQAFLLAQETHESPLPLLLDREGNLVHAIPEKGILVADPFLEIYHLGPVEGVEEILDWVRFTGAQCPECVLPEAEWL
ncbi:MAG: hypothetical protein ABWJ63_04605 [Thermus sp.]|uniref:Alkyl hydroperoxide reductase subunit C/ Thiol specific antioxidant domain-containing protein n=1 Tax=Thermus brevis TaxID=2862456 RepID=A0ABS6ZUE6_9DEIN|nr:hypothetical protein [Thermus brevis]MBW6393666.1 hypothetical protein [Thermus brevis]